jgi:WXG100 family type VII secretion target
MADEIKADYQKLEEVSKRFNALHDQAREMRSNISAAYIPVVDGGWEGKGSKAFIEEIRSSITPSLKNLEQALTDAGTVAKEISQKFRDSEQAASKIKRS